MNTMSIQSTQQLTTQLTLLLIALSLVTLSLGLPTSPKIVNHKLYKHLIRTRSVPKRYCGNYIISTLSMLCDGNYFSPSKRNHLKDESKQNSLNKGMWSVLTSGEDYSKPDDNSKYFLDSMTAFDMFGSSDKSAGAESFSRNRRGIVDECCRKACTIKELYSYCE